MINILYMLPSISDANGISSFVFNYLEGYDQNKYHISILANEDNASNYYIDYCKKNNIELILLPNFKEKGLKVFLHKLKEYFKAHKNNIDIFHCNVTNQGAFALKYAKKYGVKVRIIHSHATCGSDNKIKAFITDMLAVKAKMNANTYFACSTEAGKFLFKNKKFYMIYNAIDFNKYEYNENYRKELRNKYNILENEKCVGFIGRFARQKNVLFIVDILKELRNENYKFILVGSGELKEELELKIKEDNLESKVIIVNSTNEAYKYYSMFDCFILPSLYEGLPVVGIEAEVNGLNVLLSNNISKETIFTNKALMIEGYDSKIWADNIRKSNRENFIIYDNRFNINEERNNYFNLLEELLKKEN